eukprot:gene16330-biopygen3760
MPWTARPKVWRPGGHTDQGKCRTHGVFRVHAVSETTDYPYWPRTVGASPAIVTIGNDDKGPPALSQAATGSHKFPSASVKAGSISRPGHCTGNHAGVPARPRHRERVPPLPPLPAPPPRRATNGDRNPVILSCPALPCPG